MVTTRLDMAKYVTEPTIDDAPTTPRKPVPLTRDQCRLLATASAVESFRYRDACDLLGGEPWHILNTLRLVGAIEHPAYDRWVITEKGRIAVALAMAKDPELSNLLGTVPCHDDGTGTPAAASGTVTGHSDSGGQGWHGGRK